MTSSRFLLDTNVLLWALHRDHRLPTRHAEIIEAKAGLVVSVVSIWEIAIKRSINKLRLDADVIAALRASAVRILHVNEHHAAAVEHLPHHHRDPFDRLLVAQARIEQLTMLTVDRHIPLYEVDVA